MIKRKLQAMHAAYGVCQPPHKCHECSHFRIYDYRDKRYFKCAAYGISQSEATDWRANYTACGLFNQPMGGKKPMLEWIKHQSKSMPVMVLDGQIELEVGV